MSFTPPCKLIMEKVSPRIWWYGKLYEDNNKKFCPVCSCNSISGMVSYYRKWKRKRLKIQDIDELKCTSCKTKFLVIHKEKENDKNTWIWCRY